MNQVLNRELFLVKEQVGAIRAANHYDVYDPDSGELILQCREPRLGMWTRLLRFTDYKRFTPFNVEVRTPSGELVVGVKRGVAVFKSSVFVYNGSDETIGMFAQKLLSLGGAFKVQDSSGKQLCELKMKMDQLGVQFPCRRYRACSRYEKVGGTRQGVIHFSG
jgi:hypothetical protein